MGDTEIPCLDTSNQYFTPSRNAPDMNNTPFHVGIDPQDILASMMSGFVDILSYMQRTIRYNITQVIKKQMGEGGMVLTIGVLCLRITYNLADSKNANCNCSMLAILLKSSCPLLVFHLKKSVIRC